MIYKIIVDKQSRTNSSLEKREYTIDIEELRLKGDIYDDLTIENNKVYVTRRLYLSKYQVLSILDEPIIEELDEVNIQLFKGDNYIYLLDMNGNKLYAEYIIKNDFTDIYCTKNEMNSAMNQTAQKIELSVNQKLTGYSTTEEMNSAISIKADNITSVVSKKVGNNEIISKINQSAETVGINANKINLSAGDVLNLLAGNTINLSSKNINISSDILNIGKDGKMKIKGKGSVADLFRVEDTSNTSYFSYLQPTGAGFVHGSSGNAVYILAGDTSMVTVSDNNGAVDLTGSGVHQTSLEKYKKNFEKLENGLDIIKTIDIYKYNLRGQNDGDKKHIGFIIGDKYNYSKEITSDQNNGVNLYSFISVCCKGIQELAKENEKLEKRIKVLEKEEINGNT